jgi:lantibiotic modifying enzyme
MILPPDEGAIHSDAQVCILEIAGISMMLTMVFTKSAKRKILYILLGQSKGCYHSWIFYQKWKTVVFSMSFWASPNIATIAGLFTKSEKTQFCPCPFGTVQKLLP